ncbi:MAG: histidine kinase [Acidobacteriota bacterium]|nr:histidine kinase [Acidobacteriota bacterium]
MTTNRLRLGLFAVGAWTAVALLCSVALVTRPEVPLSKAIVAAFQPSLLLGIIALAARYPCRAMPLRKTPFSRVLATHVGAAVAAASVWLFVWKTMPAIVTPNFPLVFAVGVVIYDSAVTVHYLTLELEASRIAEEAALRYQVLAREAELKAFKAQVDPHFLFNSLNAVASLCGSRPNDARQMAQLMADFFRMTLRISSKDRIPLTEEIDLVSRYLAIEKVRFGSRLASHIDMDAAAGRCLVPPLLLQPLIENSVRHGIASVVDGGTIDISANTTDGMLRIRIDNPADPDRPQPRGESIGLQNARGRLAAISNGRASLRTEEAAGKYRVEIELPA